MSSRIAFQTQLASIMEVLANAAVAEICKLVDDDYAVISLQMSQCQRENKALKRKLHLLELRMARGCAERRIRESSLNRASRIQVSATPSDKYRGPSSDLFPNQDELYSRQLSEDIWRDREPSGTDMAVVRPVVKDDENVAGDSGMTEPNTVLVKAETSDEGPPPQELFIREDGVAEAASESGEAGYAAVQVDKDDHHSRTRRQALERPEVIEVESAEEGDDLSVWDSSKMTGRRQALQRYTTASTAEIIGSVNLPTASQRQVTSNLPALASTSSVGQDMDSWQHAKSISMYQPRVGRPRNERVPHEKLFTCNYCGKAFNRPKKVEIHQRIHTGEKPFRCNTCGKFFAEAGNLKKHQKVHTGERPYSCTQCGKTFAWIRNLKTHQQKYHPDMFIAEELLSLGEIKN
ncbi:zinc finger protein 3 homolog isoform X2 [Electrophorus electricus]|uniref:zinc finger protein 3 homolog isoform X2 n=1 Tax=Electrophorus electricus TaxID=8005 RepID=UPI0015CFDF11|nr:zinc finger protein 3 homolog isoform X2 [Electrophorus electricus]